MTLFEWKKENRFTFTDIREMLDMDISTAMLSYIFNGDRPPSIKLMKKLKEITGLSLDEIIEDYKDIRGITPYGEMISEQSTLTEAKNKK